MADVEVKPAFVSPKPSSSDSTKIDGPRWNAARLFSGGADGEVVVRDSASATGASWMAMLPPVPVTSNSQIPNGQARIFVGDGVYALRYNDNGTFIDIASVTE